MSLLALVYLGIAACQQPQAQNVMVSFEIMRAPVAASQLPPLPKKATMKQWEDYSMTVIGILFPDEESEIKKTSVKAQPKSGVFFGQSSIFGNEIFLNISAVNSVVRTPEDFAALIGHEFSHFILLRNQITQEGHEDETDLIGASRLERGACIWANVIERTLTAPAYKHISNPDFYTLNMERVNKLRKVCGEN